MLHPGEFVLGSSLEMITLPDYLAARLEGKSGLGRLGLVTHSTADHPVARMEIGQVCVFRLSTPAGHSYGSSVYVSRYEDQRGPTPSRAWRNRRNWPTG